MMDILKYKINASYTDHTIRVYQAYSNEIADSVLKAGKFVSPPFKFERMTWIKPSFLWMMYRSGWAQKDTNQVRILAIDLTHEGFKWALQNSCLSKKPLEMEQEEWLQVKVQSPVRIQWDPERNIFLEPLETRAIQIGLSGIAVQKYVNEWIYNITDITENALAIKKLLDADCIEETHAKLPVEKEYFLD